METEIISKIVSSDNSYEATTCIRNVNPILGKN